MPTAAADYECANVWVVATQGLQRVVTKTSLQSLTCVGFCFFCCFGFLLWGIIDKCICFAIGFVYPMYGSFLAVEDGNMDQVLQWAKYWMVFNSFTMFEYFGQGVICWVPLYGIGRTIFFIWLVHPLTRGSQIVYNYFAAWLTKHLNGVDSLVEEFKAVVNLMARKVREYMKSELCRAADVAWGSENAQGATRQSRPTNRNMSPAPCTSSARKCDVQGIAGRHVKIL